MSKHQARSISRERQRSHLEKIHSELSERVEALDTSANLATLTTNRRVLIFRAPSGSWEERRRNLR